MQNEALEDVQPGNAGSPGELGGLGDTIDVTVVVPVRNEKQSLAELIASLQAQTSPPAEIVVVDGGSTDGTISLAHRLAAGDDRLRVIEAGEATPGRGRNIGIAAARYEWIALADAGNKLEPQWLGRLIEVVHRDPTVGFDLP
ncbi:MAG: glycosyltransferase family A protein [Acidobacteriota bacterium]